MCRELLQYVDRRYGQPDIIVTENGVDVPGESGLSYPDVLHDPFRENYIQTYLDQVSICTILVQLGIRPSSLCCVYESASDSRSISYILHHPECTLRYTLLCQLCCFVPAEPDDVYMR